MPFTPDKTVAVIVGIEDYEISKSLEGEARWDLDGPASDAVRFAQWLRDKKRDVPSENIHVFQSALSPALREKEFAALDVGNLSDASQKTLENFFLNTLSGLAPGADGQLFLLWGGHGILRAAEHRHLYCADVLPNTVRTIWLNDLLRWLAQMTGFARQYIFVDACANAHEDTDLKPPFFHAMGPEKPPSGVEQYALLAASAGQLAVNRRDLHSGLFSSFLFEALESLQQWPDFTELEKVIVERFEQKYAADTTFNQRPISITLSDHTNGSRTHNHGGTPVPRSLQALAQATGYSVGQLQNLAAAAARCASLETVAGRGYFYTKFGFREPSFRADGDYDRLNLIGRTLLAAQTGVFLNELKAREPDVTAYAEIDQAFQQAALVRAARTELHSLQIETSEYRRMFSLLLPRAEASNPEAMLDLLAARGPVGSCALFEFFFRVADCAACQSPVPLRNWVKRHADPQHYADLEGRRARTRSYTAVVSVKPSSGKDEIPESFSVWLLENGRATGNAWTEKLTGGMDDESAWEELKRRLEAVLQKAIETAAGPVLVEIAIPMHLMRKNFDQLGIRNANSRFPRLIGRDHALVVRWRDRQKLNAIWAGPWRAASACIRGRLAATTARWHPLPDQPDEAYLTALETPPGEFLYLGAPQPPSREDDPDWLYEVIVAGVPFAGWMVKPAANPANIPLLLDGLLTGQFEELPQRIPDARRDAKRCDIHALILLWDDPDRRYTVLLEEPA